MIIVLFIAAMCYNFMLVTNKHQKKKLKKTKYMLEKLFFKLNLGAQKKLINIVFVLFNFL